MHVTKIKLKKLAPSCKHKENKWCKMNCKNFICCKVRNPEYQKLYIFKYHAILPKIFKWKLECMSYMGINFVVPSFLQMSIHDGECKDNLGIPDISMQV